MATLRVAEPLDSFYLPDSREVHSEFQIDLPTDDPWDGWTPAERAAFELRVNLTPELPFPVVDDLPF